MLSYIELNKTIQRCYQALYSVLEESNIDSSLCSTMTSQVYIQSLWAEAFNLGLKVCVRAPAVLDFTY